MEARPVLNAPSEIANRVLGLAILVLISAIPDEFFTTCRTLSSIYFIGMRTL